MKNHRIALISFLTNSLSIRLLSAYLKKNGFEVICIFCSVAPHRNNIESIIGVLRDKEISLVGITLVTDDYHNAVTLTSAIKKSLGLRVIWGGAHPSIMPEECLRHADMICVGEGEEALLELAKDLSNGHLPSYNIKNIYFKRDNGIVRNELRDLEEDLDKYPFPDFDFNSQFLINENGIGLMSGKDLEGVYNTMTSRGCPYSCSYCYNSYRRAQYKDKGRYLRMRSIENVLDELDRAKEIFGGLKAVNFWDDAFFARRPSDFDKFKNIYPKSVNLPFFALIEPMAFNGEKVRALADCGLKSLQIGIQSGSESLNRDFYHRPVLNKNISKMANTIHDLRILPIYDFIFNNPYETKEDLGRTVDLLLQLPRPFQLQGYNLIFYPGSEITRKALDEGFITPKTDAGEDFTSIQSEENSPFAPRGKNVVSSRFYTMHYDPKEKSYFNSLIILASYARAPKPIIRFFRKSETGFKRFLLNIFYDTYVTLSRLKNRNFSIQYE